MSTVKIATSKITALADAIRAKSGGNEEITLNDIPIIIPTLSVPPTWADGSWDDISQLLDDHKAGKINLYETPGWEIGAVRNVDINAIAQPSSGVGEKHSAQTVEIVLTDKNVYDLADGSGKCVYTWDLKNVLWCRKDEEYGGTTYISDYPEQGSIRDSAMGNRNRGGWASCHRKTWCNNAFYNALPEKFKSIIQEVVVKSGSGDGDFSISTSNNFCFFRSIKEITDLQSDGRFAEGEGTLLEYYSTPANRIKYFGRNMIANGYWTRSPYYYNTNDQMSTNSTGWYAISQDGDKWYREPATQQTGIAPCGCI